MANHYPRNIQPELIQAGDIIEVEYRETDGITTIKRGMVAYVQPHGEMRHFVTQVGATIAQYAAGKRSANFGKSFRILGRHIEQTPMFDNLTELGRI